MFFIHQNVRFAHASCALPLVVTRRAPPLDARRYAELAVLPTASGLVVRPYADDLDVVVSSGHVTITRPGGLAMTKGPISSAQSPQALLRGDDSPAFLDLANL